MVVMGNCYLPLLWLVMSSLYGGLGLLATGFTTTPVVTQQQCRRGGGSVLRMASVSMKNPFANSTSTWSPTGPTTEDAAAEYYVLTPPPSVVPKKKEVVSNEEVDMALTVADLASQVVSLNEEIARLKQKLKKQDADASLNQNPSSPQNQRGGRPISAATAAPEPGWLDLIRSFQRNLHDNGGGEFGKLSGRELRERLREMTAHYKDAERTSQTAHAEIEQLSQKLLVIHEEHRQTVLEMQSHVNYQLALRGRERLEHERALESAREETRTAELAATQAQEAAAQHVAALQQAQEAAAHWRDRVLVLEREVFDLKAQLAGAHQRLQVRGDLLRQLQAEKQSLRQLGRNSVKLVSSRVAQRVPQLGTVVGRGSSGLKKENVVRSLDDLMVGKRGGGEAEVQQQWHQPTDDDSRPDLLSYFKVGEKSSGSSRENSVRSLDDVMVGDREGGGGGEVEVQQQLQPADDDSRPDFLSYDLMVGDREGGGEAVVQQQLQLQSHQSTDVDSRPDLMVGDMGGGEVEIQQQFQPNQSTDDVDSPQDLMVRDMGGGEVEIQQQFQPNQSTNDVDSPQDLMVRDMGGGGVEIQQQFQSHQPTDDDDSRQDLVSYFGVGEKGIGSSGEKNSMHSLDDAMMGGGEVEVQQQAQSHQPIDNNSRPDLLSFFKVGKKRMGNSGEKNSVRSLDDLMMGGRGGGEAEVQQQSQSHQSTGEDSRPNLLSYFKVGKKSTS